MNDKYKFDNPDNNYWLNIYNKMIDRDYGHEATSLHHIFPKAKFPELANDKRNHKMLPVHSHWKAHYYLWKYSCEYALEFQFINNWMQKKYNVKLTDDENIQLREDIKKCRALKRKAKK